MKKNYLKAWVYSMLLLLPVTLLTWMYDRSILAYACTSWLLISILNVSYYYKYYKPKN